MGELEGSRSVPNPVMLRRLCIMQLLSAADNLWAPLCPFSLRTLLIHVSVRGSESGGKCFRGESACWSAPESWPWDLSLSLTPALFSRWWRKGASRVIFLWLWLKLLCSFRREKEMGQLGGKKDQIQLKYCDCWRGANTTSRTLLSHGGFDDPNLWCFG